jgi:hypothetical protein
MLEWLPEEDEQLKDYDGMQVLGYVQHFMVDDGDEEGTAVWASIQVLDKTLPFQYDVYHRYLSSDPDTVDRPMSEFYATWFPKNQ